MGRVYEVSRQVFWKAKNRVAKYERLKKRYPECYLEAAKKPVDENKVVFIELRLPELTNSFQSMYKELALHYDFDIHCHFLRTTFVKKKEHEERCLAMIEDIATAKYVFLNEASNIIGSLPIRKETVITQLWHGCGAFKKFGMSTADLIFGENRRNMLKYPFNKNYTHVTVSSPEVIWAYEEAMNIKPEEGIIKALGSSRTDVFYDDIFIRNAKKKLYDLMPEAKDKKVILFAPTFRGRVAEATSPDCFDVNMFAEHFSDDYVLLFKHHPLVRVRPEIPDEHSKFAKDFTDTMAIDELLCVADICISDYSSLVFEYSLFEKPMIFYAYDLDEYFDWRGFYYDYFELAPGPIVTTNEEMIDYIENIDERFDKKKVQDFREKFMSACDGHATTRILDTVMGSDILEKHRYGIEQFKDQIKTSVVLAVRNCEDTLPVAIESIMMQTLREIEIICVDMNSADDSMKILQHYAEIDDRIRILNAGNVTMDEARQKGMEAATGKYILFGNGDNTYHKDTLKALFKEMEKHDADLGVCNVDYMPHKNPFSKKDIEKHIFSFANSELWNKMFRMNFLEENTLNLAATKDDNEIRFVIHALDLAKTIIGTQRKLVRFECQNMGQCLGKSSKQNINILDQYYKLREELEHKDDFNNIKRSFVNCSLRDILESLRGQENLDDFRTLYNRFKTEGMEKLEMADKEDKYFYLEIYRQELKRIKSSDADTYVYYVLKEEQAAK